MQICIKTGIVTGNDENRVLPYPEASPIFNTPGNILLSLYFQEKGRRKARGKKEARFN